MIAPRCAACAGKNSPTKGLEVIKSVARIERNCKI